MGMKKPKRYLLTEQQYSMLKKMFYADGNQFLGVDYQFFTAWSLQKYGIQFCDGFGDPGHLRNGVWNQQYYTLTRSNGNDIEETFIRLILGTA